MSSVTVLQTSLPTNPTTTSSTNAPTSSATTPLGPFQAGGRTPLRKPAPINPLAQACLSCGADLTHSRLAEDSQRRIAELEAQVRILTVKATAAVDKLADYEDELRRLKSTPQTPISATESTPPDSSITPRPQQQHLPPTSSPSAQPQQQQTDRSRHNRSPSPAPPAASTAPNPTPPPPPQAAAAAAEKPPPRPTTASRLTSLLPSASIRRTSSSSSPAASPRTPKDLQALLTQEQTLRLAAERRVTQTNSEIEELSAQLFTEANEMVATERKARARLEERVVVLEKREREKAGRLEVLERRVGRVERVRGILAQGGVLQMSGP